MALISFSVFKDKILSGAKRHTIRAERKRPIKVGDKLYMWWKSRSPKEKEKLGESTCTNVLPIFINHDGVNIDEKIIINKAELDNFAIADGFDDWQHMRSWFCDAHGLPFTGVLIQWDSIKSPL